MAGNCKPAIDHCNNLTSLRETTTALGLRLLAARHGKEFLTWQCEN